MATRGAAPEAAIVLCPDCGEEQLHDVLQATPGAGAQHATVSCRECGRVHRTVLRPTRTVEVPVILSRQQESLRTSVALPEDERVSVGDELVAAEQQVQVRAIDRRDGKRVRAAKASDVATLWVIHFEELVVKVSVNMGQKTISKGVPVSPQDTFTVGDEFDLDRLRIYIHAIRVEGGTIHRGTAEAKDIKRIFARPVRLSPDERRERRRELGIPEPKRRVRPRGMPESTPRSRTGRPPRGQAGSRAPGRPAGRAPTKGPPKAGGAGRTSRGRRRAGRG